MSLTNAEFEVLLSDTTKRIDGDIAWRDDEDHSPSVEFRVEVASDAGYDLFVKGTFNPLARALSLALIHRPAGRIYALDLGNDHHNPSCVNVGTTHKHRWTEKYRDKEAYVPDDITAGPLDVVMAWAQFCAEANITHNGTMSEPPPVQEELFA